MVKHRIGCGGDADAVAGLGDGDVLAIDKIHPVARLNRRGRAAIAGQIPALLQLADAAGVRADCVCLLAQLRGLIAYVQTVLRNRIALRCLGLIGSKQLRACYRIF